MVARVDDVVAALKGGFDFLAIGAILLPLDRSVNFLVSNVAARPLTASVSLALSRCDCARFDGDT